MERLLIRGVLLLAVVVGLGWAYYMGPGWIGYYKMQDITGTAALTWANYNQGRSEINLKDALRTREVSAVTPADCKYVERGAMKVVTCTWNYDVDIPVVGRRRTKFHVEKAAGQDGRLAN